MHRLIGEHGDEEVPVTTIFFVMIDRAHAEFGFKASQHGLYRPRVAGGRTTGLGQ